MGLLNAISGEGGRPHLLPALTLGVVTSLEDPDKLGRVRVRLLSRGPTPSETGFLRVLTPMAGAEWGFFCLPEVGDEVLVGFCDGDVHSPYVLGSLWNGKNKQPAPIEGGKNDLRLVKTRSGHTISFDDKDGEEKLELISAKGLCISLDDKEQTLSVTDKDGKNQVLIEAKNGAVTVKADQKLTLQAGKCTITLDGAGGAIALESGGQLELKGQQVALDAKAGVAIAAKATVEITASGQLTMEAKGPASLKGAMLKLN